MAIARTLVRGGLLALALTSAAVTAKAVCRVLRTFIARFPHEDLTIAFPPRL
jgi:hypothetical protein